MDSDDYTIAETVARCGLPESTLRYWERSAREVGDLDKAADVAEELGPLIRRFNPKDSA